MTKALWWRFGKYLDAFICWLSKRFLKQRFLESGLTKIFTVSSFLNTLAMTIILFSECVKFDVDSRNGTKSWEKAFGFSDNCILIGSCKFSQSWTGYLPSAVNVLTNNPKISLNTRRDTFEINFPNNNEKHYESALMEILQVFGTLSHVECQFVFCNDAI